MKSLKNIKSILNSSDDRIVKRALALIHANPNIKLEKDVKKLTEHKDRRIRELSKTILEKILSSKNAHDSKILKKISSIDIFLTDYSSFKQKENRIKLLKSLNHYSIKKSEHKTINNLINVFLTEEDRSVAHLFSKIIIKWFGSELIPFLLKALDNKNKNYKINSMMILMKLDESTAIQKIIELYETNDNNEFIFFASCHIWKYSKLLVITKLKNLAQGNRENRINASKLCFILAHKKLEGIIHLLLEDSSETVRNKARAALANLEKRGTQPDTFIRYSHHLSDNFFNKFEMIIKESNDFHEKIMVMNILDNLGHTEFLPLVDEELQKESNNFLIASYVKFLGKYGKNQYSDIIHPYLESNDFRIVANCIEGLSHGDSNEKLNSIYSRFIKSRDHRISSVSAFALWKSGKKEMVSTYLKNGLNSKKLWKRKACLHILEYIRDPSMINLAKDLCEDHNQSIQDRAKTLVKILQVESNKDEATQNQIIDYLIETGKVPHEFISTRIKIIKSINMEMGERIKAANELCSIATDENYKALYRCFVGASDPYLKAALVKTVGMTFTGGKEFLFDILKKDYDARVIANAIESLAFYDYSDRIDEIFPFLYHDNQRVVTNTVIILHEVMPDKIFHKISLMVESIDIRTRKSALFALNRIRSFESYVLIRKLVNDKELDIAVTASEFISSFDNEFNFVERFNKAEKTETIDTSNENTLIELFNEIDKSSKKNIPDIAAKIEQQLTDENSEYLLSYLETTENEFAKSNLCSLLGKFSKIKIIYNFIASILDSNDKRIIANTFEGLLKNHDDPHFFDELLKGIESDEERIRLSALKVLLTNPIYGSMWFEKIERSSGDSSCIPIHYEKTTSSDQNSNTKDSSEEIIESTIYSKKNVFIAGGIMVSFIVIIIILNLGKNNLTDSKIIVMGTEKKESTKTLKKKHAPIMNTTNPKIFSNVQAKQQIYNQGIAHSKWRKIRKSNQSGKLKRLALLELIIALEKKYRHGELYRCKQMVMENLFDGAEIELRIVFDNINQGLVIQDFKIGKWVHPEK